jgi:hypothetical protein
MAGFKKKKYKKPVYLTVRRFWTRNPVTRVKEDERKESIKKSRRKKVEIDPEDIG